MPTTDTLVPMSPYLAELGDAIRVNLAPFTVSLHLEVRERACQLQTILDIASTAEAETPGQGVAIIEQFAVVLSEEVQPVSLKAQRKVEPHPGLLITAPLSNEWDYLLASSDGDEDEEDVGRGKKKKKDGKKGGKSKSKDVTDLFAQKKSKEQIAREEQEAREMLARHREKMGNYYLGGEVPASAPEEGKKKKKKGKKDQAVEALPAPVRRPPEPEIPAYMRASMAGIKMARPAIKGESDSSEEDEDESARAGGGKMYAPKNSATALHAGLGGYDPLKPLGRGEEMPSVEAYPAFDPYANEGGSGNNAFSVPQKGERRRDKKDRKEKKAEREETKRRHEEKKAKKAAKAANGDAKPPKEAKEKKASRRRNRPRRR